MPKINTKKRNIKNVSDSDYEEVESETVPDAKQIASDMHIKLTKGMAIGKKNDDIETPTEFYNVLDKEFKFDFDPCPINSERNPDFDGLNDEWGNSNYVNPPFSEIKKWIIKAIIEMNKGKKSVFLLTARIGSQYWMDHVWPNASEIRFLRGKLKFKGYDTGLPHHLAVVVFDPAKKPSHSRVEKYKWSPYEFACIK